MTIQIKQFTPTSHKIKAVLYGASGSGKTVFAGTADKAIFASAEGGLLSIKDKHPNYVEIHSLADLRELGQYLKTQKHGFETVVIDSITEINEVIKLDIDKRNGRPMQLQDWGTLSKDIRGLLRQFRDLPMHVLFLAQETAEDKDESGKATKIVPSLNGKAATEIAYFMDIVGYMLVTPSGEHKILTSPSPKYITKDRSNAIGNDAPVDFSEWVRRVTEGVEIGEEKTTDSYTAAPPKPKTVFDVTMDKISAMTSIAELMDALEKVGEVKNVTAKERADIRSELKERIAKMTNPKVPIDPAYADARLAAEEALRGMDDDEETTIVHDEETEEDISSKSDTK